MQRSDSGISHPTDIFSRNSAPLSKNFMASAADESAAAPGASSEAAPPPSRGDGDHTGEAEPQPLTPLSSSRTLSIMTMKNNELDKEKPKRRRRRPSKPWKKPKDMPRRPLSAYNLFFKERRETMMKANLAAESSQASAGKKKSNKSVGIGFANLAKTIATEWKTLDPNTRVPYEERAAVEKSRYDKEMLVWRAKQREEKAAVSASAEKGTRTKTSEKKSSTVSTFVEDKSNEGPQKAIGRATGAVDLSFRAQAKNSPTDIFQNPGPHNTSLHDPMHISLHGTPSTMEGMMMMGTQFPFQHALWQPQLQQDEMGRGGFPSMADVGSEAPRFEHDLPGQFAEYHASGSQDAPQDDGASSFFHRMGGIPDQRQQLMMMQHQQQHIMNMAGGDNGGSPQRFDALLSNPNSRMATMIGALDEYEPQSQSMPSSLGGRQVADQAMPSMNHSINDFQHQSLTADHGVYPGRRNTWSGMSQAQHETFHQMQMERLQREEELLQAQLRQHRRMYMEHERQVQEERHRRSSLREFDLGRFGNRFAGVEEMAAHRVGRHPHSWTELTPETPANPQRQAETKSLEQIQSQLSSSNRYPSAWFEADSNVEDARGNLSDDLLRHSPDLHGDLNQKLPGRAMSSSSAPPFGGQQIEAVLKEGRKSEGDPWNPIQLKEKERAGANPSCCLQPDIEKMHEHKKSGADQSASLLLNDGQQQSQRVDPSSVQALGLRLDEESVSFLANLRFGGELNTPDGSPSSGNSR